MLIGSCAKLPKLVDHGGWMESASVVFLNKNDNNTTETSRQYFGTPTQELEEERKGYGGDSKMNV